MAIPFKVSKKRPFCRKLEPSTKHRWMPKSASTFSQKSSIFWIRASSLEHVKLPNASSPWQSSFNRKTPFYDAWFTWALKSSAPSPKMSSLSRVHSQKIWPAGRTFIEHQLFALYAQSPIQQCCKLLSATWSNALSIEIRQSRVQPWWVHCTCRVNKELAIL